MPLGFVREEIAHTHSRVTNAVARVEPSTVLVRGVKAIRSVECSLRRSEGNPKRRYNPHVLPFHHFSFEGYWGNWRALRALLREEGFSTCLKQSSSKCFTKRWMSC